MSNNNKEKDLSEMINNLVDATILEYGGGMRLRDIVLQPAKDLASTVGYAASRLSSAAQALVKGIAYIIPTILIPGLEFNYNLFAKDQQMQLDGIKKKYGKALEANWEAIKDPDVFGFLFLAYPQSMLGFSLLKRSPLLFLNALETITGGNESVSALRQSLASSAAYSPRTTNYRDPNASSVGYSGDYAGLGYDGGGYGGGFGESKNPLKENQPIQPTGNTDMVVQQIQQLMQKPDVQQALQNSPAVQEMKNAAIKIMVNPIARAMKATTLDQLAGIISPQAIKNAKAAIMKEPNYSKLDPKAKEQAVVSFVQQAKAGIKAQYIKNLQAQAAKVPGSKPAVDAAIQQITALK